jgi:sirohydrochlorin ferrochelatase
MTEPHPLDIPGRPPRPVLVAVAHGSRDPRALATVRALLARVAARRPGLDVRLGHIELNEPLLDDTLAAVRGEAVLVPLLLGRGHHVKSDLPAALTRAVHLRGTIAPPLGPHPLLAEVLQARLEEAGWQPALVRELPLDGTRPPRADEGPEPGDPESGARRPRAASPAGRPGGGWPEGATGPGLSRPDRSGPGDADPGGSSGALRFRGMELGARGLDDPWPAGLPAGETGPRWTAGGAGLGGPSVEESGLRRPGSGDLPGRGPSSGGSALRHPPADQVAPGLRPPGTWRGNARVPSAVVLAAAGSRDAESAVDTRRTAALLSRRLGGIPVVPGYASAAAPTVGDVFRGFVAAGHRAELIAVASYFTAPGRFATQSAAVAPAGAAAPLGAHPAMAELILRRYDRAVVALRYPAALAV